MDFQGAAFEPRPADHGKAALAGRVWDPEVGGPSVVAVRGEELFDITAAAPTMRDLCEAGDPARLVRSAAGRSLGPLAAILANTPRKARDAARPWLLAPIDLQAVKAAGVTFAVSMLERVIEEQARGDASRAESIRTEITATIGDDLRRLKPGSEQAAALKELLIEKGMWSQYLEVGIGPDAEVFTKAQPMSAVGHLAEAGLHPKSSWNNPEPEVALLVSGRGRILGATLGNDVNLRDVEGRSALLLGKAKDNNASASLGPFIRLFDGDFTLETVSNADIDLAVVGEDGFELKGKSSMSQISRTPESLVKATIGAHHQYPDGLVLYLGTMFAPIQDRDGGGKGFTHKLGDTVSISTPTLGTLSNRVRLSTECPPWTYGASHLMRDLAQADFL